MKLLLISLIWAIGVWGTQIITQSVGHVGKDVVTSREVQIALAISRILENNDPKTAPVIEIQLKDNKFPDVVSNYLIDKAAQAEAEAFGVGQPTDDELKTASAKIEKAVAGKTYWQNLESDAANTKKILITRLVAKNFIQVKSDSMSSIVTDAEAQSYFEKNRLKFGESPFESFKENIQTFLAQQQKQDRLRSWFEVLKKKYNIRNLLLENVKTPQQTSDTQNPPARK